MNRRILAVLSLCFPLAAAAAGRDAPATPTLVTPPMPFVGITPCRIVDTRDSSMPAGYGPPSLAAGVPRSFTLAGRCGIPAGAAAVSLNVTVVGPQGTGYVLLYPQGGSQPGVSTLNYGANQTVANAAVVPLGVGGGITVAAALVATDLVIDTNGYFGASALDASNVFLGEGAGNTSTAGTELTGVGLNALSSNSSAAGNTAAGEHALLSATSGPWNTAVGVESLAFLQDGDDNVAFGVDALAVNVSGTFDVAVGVGALVSSPGGNNVAIGKFALSGISGFENNNAAFGNSAGSSLSSDGGNLYVASPGVSDDSLTIRVGSVLQTRAYIAGIRGAVLGGALLVEIDPAGQLGIVSSSARYKQDVRTMGAASDALSRLRPVSFHYKDQPERFSYGLIAEEVERVLPELVVCDAAGEAASVQYQEIPAMLVNELEKQRWRLGAERERLDERREAIERQERALDRRETQIRELEARIVGLERGSYDPALSRPEQGRSE